MEFLLSLLFGGIAGWIAGLIKRGQGYGFFGNILVGIIGGFVGTLLFSLFGLETTYFIGELISAVIGAIIFLSLINVFQSA